MDTLFFGSMVSFFCTNAWISPWLCLFIVLQYIFMYSNVLCQNSLCGLSFCPCTCITKSVTILCVQLLKWYGLLLPFFEYTNFFRIYSYANYGNFSNLFSIYISNVSWLNTTNSLWLKKNPYLTYKVDLMDNLLIIQLP